MSQPRPRTGTSCVGFDVFDFAVWLRFASDEGLTRPRRSSGAGETVFVPHNLLDTSRACRRDHNLTIAHHKKAMHFFWNNTTSQTNMSACNAANDDRSVGSNASATSTGSSTSSFLLASADSHVVVLTQHWEPGCSKRRKTEAASTVDAETMPPPSAAVYPFMLTVSTQDYRPNRPRASSMPTILEVGRSGGHRRSTTELVGPTAINFMRVSETHSSD